MGTPRRLLIDTGPLVAWMDADDRYHPEVDRCLGAYDGRLFSTWLVIGETCHLLPRSLRVPFMGWVAAGGVELIELPPSAAPMLAERMGKYADLPMDLADASLIWLAERTGVLDVATLDRRDFGIYRTRRGKVLRNVLDLHRVARNRRSR